MCFLKLYALYVPLNATVCYALAQMLLVLRLTDLRTTPYGTAVFMAS